MIPKTSNPEFTSGDIKVPHSPGRQVKKRKKDEKRAYVVRIDWLTGRYSPPVVPHGCKALARSKPGAALGRWSSRSGAKSGVVLNPHTPISTIEHVVQDVDMVLLMTVNPGFGGQAFIESVVPKIAALRNMRQERGLDFEIEIDGGVNATTAKLCIDAGADVLVAGSAIYNEPDYKAAIDGIRNASRV